MKVAPEESEEWFPPQTLMHVTAELMDLVQ